MCFETKLMYWYRLSYMALFVVLFVFFFFFFFQAEDGIRDHCVTGVQTCALPIYPNNLNVRCNLAWVLATSPDPARRNGQRAVELASSVAQGPGRGNPIVLRSEERRVGKECRSRWWTDQ